MNEIYDFVRTPKFIAIALTIVMIVIIVFDACETSKRGG